MSSVLKPTGNLGDFVHNNQTMASNEGFSCVSRKWWEKTISMDDGINQLIDERGNREDIDCPVRHMRFGINDKNQLILEYVDGREFTFTEHSLKQAAYWCDKVSHSFIQRMTNDALKPNGKVDYKRDKADAETLLTVFSNGYRRIDPNKAFKFRTYSDGTLRAWLSDTYAPIDNVWYLEQIKSLMPNARLSHWRGNADTIYGNILIPDSVRECDDSDYGGMISPGNCEIGIRRFEQYPSVFRAICMNGCIWDQSKGNVISQVHRGEIDLQLLRAKLLDNINKQIPLMSKAIDNFMETKSKEVKSSDSLAGLFATIAKGNNWSPYMATSVVEQFNTHESDNRNLFGVINAITRAGQDKKLSNDNWLAFDMVGGSLMSTNQDNWERLLNRGNNLTVKEIEKVFGVAV